MLTWMAVSVQREIAAVNGKEDTFSHKFNENSVQVGQRPASAIKLGGDLGGPPCPRSLVSYDSERRKGNRRRRCEKPRGEMDVLWRPPGASTEDLVDPRVTETCQLADAPMREPQRRHPTHRAFTSLLRRRKSGIGAGLDRRVIGLCL
jgi:hypothetical protein